LILQQESSLYLNGIKDHIVSNFFESVKMQKSCHVSPDSWTASILLNSSDMGSSAFQNAEARSRMSFFLAELARSALQNFQQFLT